MSQTTGLSNELDLLGWLIRYGKNDLRKEAIEDQIQFNYCFMWRLRGQVAIDFLKFVSVSSDPMSRLFIIRTGYARKPHEIVLDYLYAIKNYHDARPYHTTSLAKRRRKQNQYNICYRVCGGKLGAYYLLVDLELFSGFATLYRRLGI